MLEQIAEKWIDFLQKNPDTLKNCANILMNVSDRQQTIVENKETIREHLKRMENDLIANSVKNALSGMINKKTGKK